MRWALFIGAVLLASASAGCGRTVIVTCRPDSVAACQAPDGAPDEDADGGWPEAECEGGAVTDCVTVIRSLHGPDVAAECVARCPGARS